MGVIPFPCCVPFEYLWGGGGFTLRSVLFREYLGGTGGTMYKGKSYQKVTKNGHFHVFALDLIKWLYFFKD